MNMKTKRQSLRKILWDQQLNTWTNPVFKSCAFYEEANFEKWDESQGISFCFRSEFVILTGKIYTLCAIMRREINEYMVLKK